MGTREALALLPLIILAGTVLAALVAVALHRRHWLVFGITLLGFAVAAWAILPALAQVPRPISTMLRVDNYALFFTGLLIGVGFILTLFSYDYWERRGGVREEFYILLLLGTLGGTVLAASTHFATLFLGLEITSVSIYALTAYERASRRGLEAGIKYLILAAISSAFILFGMALIYTDLGTMQVSAIIASVVGRAPQPVFMTGAALVLVGFGFKLALFPFFLWAPDVFEGAPAPVTAFLATISKGAILAVLVRFFFPLQAIAREPFLPALTVVAIATMFAGNILALRQLRLKRLLAYSSVAHMGYLLVPFLARTPGAIQVIAFYLATYFITTLGAFGVIAMLSDRERDLDRSEDYRGMARRHPWLAGVLTACLLSLAGLPVTAGFMGKFFLVFAGVGAGLWTLVIVLVINSGISIYYYLRVVRELYRRQDVPPVSSPAVSWPGAFALAVLAALFLLLGLYPAPALELLSNVLDVIRP
ncbi:MAG: NADH-quinone oxidoreductase subunit N [Armatimonadota bacterium]